MYNISLHATIYTLVVGLMCELEVSCTYMNSTISRRSNMYMINIYQIQIMLYIHTTNQYISNSNNVVYIYHKYLIL
jgi:hypothetical protein